MPPFVSTSALVVDGLRILVVADPIRQEPILPGGHLKWKEEPKVALVREVKEETGYVIEPHELIDAFTGPEWAGEQGVVRLVYRATIVGGSLTSSPEGEASWMLLEELLASRTRDAALVQASLGQSSHTPSMGHP